jgi:hypothetical protein
MKKTPYKKLFRFINVFFIKKVLFRYLPDRLFIMYDYFLTHKKFPNLKKPVSFSEKIQWIKLYGGLEKYTKYACKLEVRKFIKHTIGERYLIPIIGTWETVEDIPFDKLPDRFVLKASHGSHYLYMCPDKSKMDLKNIRKEVKNWISENFYNKTRERQYKYCQPKIICEKNIEIEGERLFDYKFLCTDGVPKVVNVAYWDDTSPSGWGDVYKDLNWNTLNIGYLNVPRSTLVIQKPENFNSLVEVAKQLSKNFPFVRVDLYSVHNIIYFGELTFTPGNGLERFSPPEADLQLGELIDLSKYSPEFNQN